VDVLKAKCKRFIIDNYDQIMEQNPNFDAEMCRVPELLLELTRAALSKKDPPPPVSPHPPLQSAPLSLFTYFDQTPPRAPLPLPPLILTGPPGMPVGLVRDPSDRPKKKSKNS